MIIYDNQQVVAETCKEHYDEFYSSNSYDRIKFININGKLQGGKTGCMIELARQIAPDEVVALTTYADRGLVAQFEQDFDNEDNVLPVRISTLLNDIKKDSDLVEEIGEASTFFIDESEYRLGEDSQLGQFIEFILNEYPNKRFLFVFVGATNYTLNYLRSNFRFPVVSITLETGKGYIGVKDFLNSPNFNHIKQRKVKLTSKIIDSLRDTLSQFNEGLYMIRIPTSIKEADKVKDILSREFIGHIQSGSLSIKSIHSKGKNGSIKRELRRATKLSMKKNVIIIVVGGLSAGFRFSENIKRNIRFVFETFKARASAIQGLIGRCCGYHNNIPTIWADKSVLEEYLRMHDDAENYIPGSKASTHTQSREFNKAYVSCEFEVQHNSVDMKELETLLGIERNDYRYSKSGQSTNFQNQWEESFEKEPNYRDITWYDRQQTLRPYHILINTDEGVSRVMRKTSDTVENRIIRKNTTSTSFLNDDKYINKEK